MRIEYRYQYLWGAFLLRFSLGLLFFAAAMGKFLGKGGVAGFLEYIQGKFAGTWLPPVLYQSFGQVIPYVEIFLGIVLMLGIFRLAGLVLGSLHMLGLAFGMMVTGDWPVVAANLFYVALFAAALLTSPWDRIHLDTLIFRRRSE